MRIFVLREELNVLYINLVDLPYVGVNNYNLTESDKMKTKFIHGQR